MAKLIKSSGEISELRPVNGNVLTLKELQSAINSIGIRIDRVDEKFIISNKNANRDIWDKENTIELPKNETVTAMFPHSLPSRFRNDKEPRGAERDDYFSGDVLVCDEEEFVTKGVYKVYQHRMMRDNKAVKIDEHFVYKSYSNPNMIHLLPVNGKDKYFDSPEKAKECLNKKILNKIEELKRLLV